MSDVRRRPMRQAGATNGAAVLRLPPESWQLRGSCALPRTAPPEDIAAMLNAFDEPTWPAAMPERLQMVRVMCASCPVVARCLDFGLNGDPGTEQKAPTDGFYGGLTPEERKARRAGDDRPHEQLVTEPARVTGTHGGPRRGVAWTGQTDQPTDETREQTG